MKRRTHMFIGIHQEDERIQNVPDSRGYIDAGLVILKHSNDGTQLV